MTKHTLAGGLTIALLLGLQPVSLNAEEPGAKPGGKPPAAAATPRAAARPAVTPKAAPSGNNGSARISGSTPRTERSERLNTPQRAPAERVVRTTPDRSNTISDRQRTTVRTRTTADRGDGERRDGERRGGGRERGENGEHRGTRFAFGIGEIFYFYDGYYYGDCSWLRRKARETGSNYWWSRYRLCREES